MKYKILFVWILVCSLNANEFIKSTNKTVHLENSDMSYYNYNLHKKTIIDHISNIEVIFSGVNYKIEKKRISFNEAREYLNRLKPHYEAIKNIIATSSLTKTDIENMLKEIVSSTGFSYIKGKMHSGAEKYTFAKLEKKYKDFQEFVLYLNPNKSTKSITNNEKIKNSLQVNIGGKQISLIVPSEFYVLDPQYSEIQKLSKEMTAPTNRLVLTFITKKDLNLIKKGELPLFKRYIRMETIRNIEDHNLTTEQFKGISSRIKREQNALFKKVEQDIKLPLNEIMNGISNDYNISMQMEIGDIIPTGIFQDNQNALGFGALSKVKVESEGANTSYIMSVGSTILLIKGKLLLLNVYSTYKDQNDTIWVKEKSIKLVNSILAINASSKNIDAQENIAESLNRSCKNNIAAGCYNLGLMYFNGNSLEKNYLLAKDLFRKTCDLGTSEGCYSLGLMYDKGVGLKQDTFKAIKAYIKACNDGMAASCGKLGLIYKKDKNYKKAMEFYKKACESGLGIGCSSVAGMYALGHGVKKDRGKTKEFRKKACNMGYGDGCENNAVIIDGKLQDYKGEDACKHPDIVKKVNALVNSLPLQINKLISIESFRCVDSRYHYSMQLDFLKNDVLQSDLNEIFVKQKKYADSVSIKTHGMIKATYTINFKDGEIAKIIVGK